MPNGPGKYDAACTAARESTGADAVLLVVLNGHRGAGFAVQSAVGPLGVQTLCDMLERIVADMRRDLERPA